MIDLKTERGIGLQEAVKLYPPFREGTPTHISTPLRHITKGIELPSGEVVRLEGARLGGRWITTVEAVQRFVERLTAATLGEYMPAEPSTVRPSARRQRELDRVDRELDKAGITASPLPRSKSKRQATTTSRGKD
jgi:hypothetical protein